MTDSTVKKVKLTAAQKKARDIKEAKVKSLVDLHTSPNNKGIVPSTSMEEAMHNGTISGKIMEATINLDFIMRKFELCMLELGSIPKCYLNPLEEGTYVHTGDDPLCATYRAYGEARIVAEGNNNLVGLLKNNVLPILNGLSYFACPSMASALNAKAYSETRNDAFFLLENCFYNQTECLTITKAISKMALSYSNLLGVSVEPLPDNDIDTREDFHGNLVNVIKALEHTEAQYRVLVMFINSNLLQ